ncbi:MAG: choice-of-anchor D domain-containing protein, partial [Wenzhouxiangella sp.]|nr:choice-of-anchor D domain-containing protein [Wenzhouxiangella sp.]
DFRVEAQGDPGSICLGGGTLPPQNYVFLPEYITTNDDGVSFVIDRKVRCDSDSSTGINTDDARIARLGPDGELQAELNLGSQRPLRLSFHPGGLPSAPEPFLYWLDPNSNPTRLLTVDQMLNGPLDTFVVDASIAQQNDPVDAAIDAQGIVYVSGIREMDAYDFEGRNFDALDYLGPVDPQSNELSRFEDAWDMDVDSLGNVYVVDRAGHRIHKFGPSMIDRSTDPTGFVAGDYIGWLGKCTGDIAPGDAAACDVARQRSIGYACKDTTCTATPATTFGADPGQFRNPRGFAIDPNDILYVADRDNDRVQRFTPNGFFAGQAKSDCEAVNCFNVGQFGIANDVSVNSTGFYVLDVNTEILHIFAADPVTMTGSDTGFVTYRSNNNFIGPDSFDWFASDGLRIGGDLVRSNIATATVEVAQNQRPPFATAGLAAQVLEDQSVAILLDGSDPDIGNTYPWEPLQNLSAALVIPPARGQVAIDGLNAVYTPDPDFNGIDAFEFAVSDGIAVSAPEAVTVEVLQVNDPPQLSLPSDPNDRRAGIGYPWELNVGVIDPDPGDSHTLEVRWGDGVIETEGEILSDGTITGPLLDFNAGGEGLVHARHVYTSAGQRSVQTCVTDSGPAETCRSFTIDVVPMTDLAVFERNAPRAIPVGQPISYVIGVSNFQGEGGAGIPATGVTVEVDLDPRLSVLGITGASCVVDGYRRVCALPDLLPIPRGASDGAPPVDRQITINALVDPALGLGTRLASRARVVANQINRNASVEVTLERVLVADADFTLDPIQADAPSANAGDGGCEDAEGRCTLRAAIEEANALGGARTIALPDGLFRLDQGPILVSGDVTLIGLGVGRSEVAAVGAQRLFNVTASARLTLIGVTLSGDEYLDGIGGLVFSDGALNIEDSLLQGGDANDGGAIFSTGTMTVRRTTFSNNRALGGGGSGGALFNLGDAIVENSLFTGNRARSGGAIASEPSSGATLLLRHATITGNQANVIGAGVFGNFSSQSMATLENTILAGNSAGNPGAAGCSNQLTSTGGNLINDDREACPFDPAPDDLLDVDPRLEPAVVLDDGRIILEPRDDSPAVDALSLPCIATDLRNLQRPQGGAACDIGAFERGIAAEATVSPAVVDFGSVGPGQFSDPQALVISSTGNLVLNVLSIERPDTPFMVVGGDCPLLPFELAPGNDCSVLLRFAPTAVGQRQVELRLDTNDPEGPSFIELRGTASQSETLFFDSFESKP